MVLLGIGKVGCCLECDLDLAINLGGRSRNLDAFWCSSHEIQLDLCAGQIERRHSSRHDLQFQSQPWLIKMDLEVKNVSELLGHYQGH